MLMTSLAEKKKKQQCLLSPQPFKDVQYRMASQCIQYTGLRLSLYSLLMTLSHFIGCSPNGSPDYLCTGQWGGLGSDSLVFSALHSQYKIEFQ